MPFKRLAQASLGCALFAFVTLTIFAGLGLLRLGNEVRGELGRIKALKAEGPPLASEVYDRRGEKIGEFATERCYYVPLAKLPPHVVQAFLSAEDKDFYHHLGISPVAIARSALADLRGGRLRQGASTITQQLARLSFLDQKKSWRRKLKEALLALAIERKLAKDQILDLYLNRIYLGNHSYGIEAAARNYFRKHADELTVGEAALLAGLPQSPSRYAPNRHPEQASRRQHFVLRRMEQDGWLRAGGADAWSRRVVRVASGPEDFGDKAPYFLDAVHRELGRMFEFERLPQAGLRIRTTLDARLQRAAQRQLAAALVGARAAAVTSGKHRRQAMIEGALVSLDPETGGVLAMQGGGNFARSQFNRTDSTRRRLGALFLPVYVALALERGYTLASRVGDDPMSGRRQPDDAGAPTLYEAVRSALTLQAAPLYTQLGAGSVLELATKLGFRFDRDDLSLALGYGEATPEDVAVAYATFMRDGRTLTPHLIESVETANGRVLYRAPKAGDSAPAFSPQTAYMLDQALVDAVRNGHARDAAGVSPLAGGMAAATDDLQNAWFVGVLPTVVSAVWIGAENGLARLAETEPEAAAIPVRAWKAYMQAAPGAYVQGAKPLPPPAGVSFARRLDVATGKRSLPFLQGTEPGQKRRKF